MTKAEMVKRIQARIAQLREDARALQMCAAVLDAIVGDLATKARMWEERLDEEFPDRARYPGEEEDEADERSVEGDGGAEAGTGPSSGRRVSDLWADGCAGRD